MARVTLCVLGGGGGGILHVDTPHICLEVKKKKKHGQPKDGRIRGGANGRAWEDQQSCVGAFHVCFFVFVWKHANVCMADMGVCGV